MWVHNENGKCLKQGLMMQVCTTRPWYCNKDTHPYCKCWISVKYLPEETELHKSGSNYICPELPPGSSSEKNMQIAKVRLQGL